VKKNSAEITKELMKHIDRVVDFFYSAFMVLKNLEAIYEKLYPAEKRVADYLLKNPEKTVNLNIAELAAVSSTSDATVLRLCKRLGFSGFYQFKIGLVKEGTMERQLVGYRGEQNDPRTAKAIMSEIAGNILQLSDQIETKTVLQCASMIRNCHTVYAVAVGNTIPVAQDFTFRLGRLGIRAISSFVPEYTLNEINLGDKEDVLIGFTHSGTSIQIIQAMDLSKKKGMKTIAITDVPFSKAGKDASKTLCVPVNSNLFQGFGAVTNIYMLVMIDVLLYFIANLDSTTEDADNLEYILANYKL